MGTCSQISGLREEIRRRSSSKQRCSQRWRVQFTAVSAEGVSSYISCIGSLVAPLDLLPEEYNAKNKMKKRGQVAERDPIRTGMIIACTCAAVGILISAVSIVRYAVNLRAEKDMRARVAALSSAQEDYDTYINYKNTDEGLTVLGKYADDANSGLVAFWMSLKRKCRLPSSFSPPPATVRA